LLELLIAATMLAVMAFGLTGQIQGAIRVWHTADEATAQLQRERVAMDLLRRDLANAIVFETRTDDGLYGTEPGQIEAPLFAADTLQWYTRLPDGRQPGGVRWVAYACEQQDDGVTAFIRSERTIAEVRSQYPPRRALLLSDCEQLAIRYAYRSVPNNAELDWQSAWDRPLNELPALVEVVLGFEHAPPLRWILPIPSGVLEKWEEDEDGGAEEEGA
jgi:type II secretory pathway pseudopilin PulG